MGFFSGLFRSRDKPQNRTTGSAYSFFFGGSAAGKRVNERSAMQMTAVYSCVRILAEAVAGLPLHLYRYKEDGGKEKALDHPLYLLLHDEPNKPFPGRKIGVIMIKEIGRSRCFRSVITHLCQFPISLQFCNLIGSATRSRL